MLAKRFRFHGYGSLKFVYSKGNTSRTRFLSMKYVKNNRRQHSRLAVVVSKKVAKRAPQRNRIRRRIYEAVRTKWVTIEPGYDLAISVFDARLADMSAEELNALINELLSPVLVDNDV